MIKRRYDKETGELGKAYPETMEIPEPYLTLSNEENNNISVDDENVYFYIDNKLTKKNKQEIERTKARIAEIKQELEALDLKSIRAIRSGDSEYIEKYEQQAETLRKELAELS